MGTTKKQYILSLFFFLLTAPSITIANNVPELVKEFFHVNSNLQQNELTLDNKSLERDFIEAQKSWEAYAMAKRSRDNKESLSDLAARIEIMLNGSAEHWEEGLLEELEKQVILYEEDHPVISRVISQIITTLNGMGL